MTSKFFQILRSRFSEILTISGLIACFFVLMMQIQVMLTKDQQPASQDAGRLFIVTAAMAAIAVLSQIVMLGFFRSVCLSALTPLDIRSLLGIGRKFFFRVFFLEMLVGLLLAVIAGFIFAGFEIINEKYSIVSSQWTAMEIGRVISIILIARLLLIAPALIVVKDCRIMSAISMSRNYKITGCRPLAVTFFLWLVFGFILSGFEHYAGSDNLLLAAHICRSAGEGVFHLIMGLLAVLYVLETSGPGGVYPPETAKSD